MGSSRPLRAHVASRFDGELIETYFPLQNGNCELMWMFDGAGEAASVPRKYLQVELTEAEAKAVFERDGAQTGILEPVRSSLTNPLARIVQNPFEGGEQRGTATFEIPRQGDELAFLESLDEVPVMTLAERKQSLRVMRATLTELELEARGLLHETSVLRNPSRAFRAWRSINRAQSIKKRLDKELGERKLLVESASQAEISQLKALQV